VAACMGPTHPLIIPIVLVFSARVLRDFRIWGAFLILFLPFRFFGWMDG